MIRNSNWLVLSTCVGSLFVVSGALADEPKTSVVVSEAGHAPPRLEPLRTSTTRGMAPAVSLRLPKFLSFNVWSAPASSSNALSNVPRPTDCRAHCAAGKVTDRTRSTTSKVLAGVGAVGLVTGVVLTIARPRNTEHPSLTPSFRMKLSGQRAIAMADWRF